MIVTIGVVAFNEEEYINDLLNDIKKQDYNHSLIEVVLVDGQSGDKTREYMEDFKKSNNDFKAIIILENTKRMQAAGWNLVIKEASGDIISRIDAHSKIPSDFISKNVKRMHEGESVTGGIRPNIVKNSDNWQRVLYCAEASMFGSSIASYRNRTKEVTYVKSMFHATYRREIFKKIGGFNERLGRTEDNELHYRIREAGYKFCLDPEIISYQYIRSTLLGMLKQKKGNGYWIGVTAGVCPGCISIFHFVPFVFVIALISTSVVALIGWSIPLLLLLFSYGLVNLLSTMQVIINEKFSLELLLLPMLFFLLHLSYGYGTVKGVMNLSKFKKRIYDTKSVEDVKVNMKI